MHNPAAAICIFSVSICLLITINGDRENILSKEFGEQSFMDKSITLIGNSINKVTGTSLVDKFTNKYKRNGVYDEYFLAAVSILVCVFQMLTWTFHLDGNHKELFPPTLNCVPRNDLNSRIFFIFYFSWLDYWIHYSTCAHVLQSRNQTIKWSSCRIYHKIKPMFKQQQRNRALCSKILDISFVKTTLT